jgi:heme exporter protein B
MGSLFLQIHQELKGGFQSVTHVLLVFISLFVAFGLLASNHPAMWEAFLPTLLMGLSYAVVSLSLDQLFREDWEDGTLEWFISEGKSLESYVLAKILMYWVRLGLPLTALIGVMTGFSSFPLLLGVALTTLSIILLGAIGSALCLKAKAYTAILLPLLILPLGIPMMIVSMAAVTDSTAALSSYLALQAGLLFIAFSVSLIACPYALKLSLR